VQRFELVHAPVPDILGIAQAMGFIDDHIVKLDLAQKRPVVRLLLLKGRDRDQDNVQ
jgi:hypothetical protein